MTDLRQAAQQALEALEGWDNYGAWVWPESALEQSKQNTIDSIAALREALAQPEQKPVAYYHPHKGFYWAKPTHISAPTVVDVPPVPLYTAPAQRPWQGLTERST